MAQKDELQRETLTHTRESEYFSVPGLRTLTGLMESQWDFALVKELIDNALDAVDTLPTKRIEMMFDGDSLTVSDNGPGIAPNVLDKVYDFSMYVSDKHDYLTATRGMQGNALKTVIGICVLRDYDLRFVIGPNIYRYVINRTMLDAGYVKFDKTVEPNPNSHASSVTVSGLNHDVTAYKDGRPVTVAMPGTLSIERILRHIEGLHLSNPDVTITCNGTTFGAVTAAKKQNVKTFIHTYDFARFNQLLQAIVVKDQNRTVKDFCLTFSGTQRILSRLEFGKRYKRLAEFNTDPDEVRALLRELKSLTKPQNPKILNDMLAGEDAFMAMFRNDRGDGDD
jgi:hypothetical protein